MSRRLRCSAILVLLLAPLLSLTVACSGRPSASPPVAAESARHQELSPRQLAYQLLEDLASASVPATLPADLRILSRGGRHPTDTDRAAQVRGLWVLNFAQDQQSELRWRVTDAPPDGALEVRVFDTAADARGYFDRVVDLQLVPALHVGDRFAVPNMQYPATCITFTAMVSSVPVAGSGCAVLVDTVVVIANWMPPGSEPQATEDRTVTLMRAGVAHIEALQAAAARRAAVPPARPVLRLGWLASTEIFFSGGLRREFLRRMEELGYHRGQDFFLDYGFADDNPDRLSGLAAQLVADRVDQIVAVDVAAAQAATRATRTIPIVVLGSQDPVAEGLATSVAHPGGNVTGLLLQDPPEIYGKRLEILADAFPGLRRVAVIGDRFDRPGWADLERVAHARGIELIRVPIRTAADLDGALSTITRTDAQAILEFDGNVAFRPSVVQFTQTHHLPVMYDGPDGLPISYAGSPQARFRRAAEIVDRIRGGLTPADLPFERPAAFRLEVDLRVAHEWGLQVAPTLVARADEVYR